MRLIRVFTFSFVLAFLMIATNNCAGTGTGFQSMSGFCSGTCATATASGPSVYLSSQGFVIGKAGTLFYTSYAASQAYYKQQFQVSGMCTTGGAAVNQISLSVNHTVAGLPVPYATDLYGSAYSNYSTTCDSGRFNLIITPPADGSNNAATFAGTVSPAMQLVVTLKTGASLSALTVASQFATTFYVTY